MSFAASIASRCSSAEAPLALDDPLIDGELLDDMLPPDIEPPDMLPLERLPLADEEEDGSSSSSAVLDEGELPEP